MSGSVTRTRHPSRGDPERARHLLERDRSLRDRGTHTDEREREEQQRVGEDEHRRGLVAETVRVLLGEVGERERRRRGRASRARGTSSARAEGAIDRGGEPREARPEAPSRSRRTRQRGAVAGGMERRGAERHAAERVRASLEDPVDRGADGDAERQLQRAVRRRGDRNLGPSEATAGQHPLDAGSTAAQSVPRPSPSARRPGRRGRARRARATSAQRTAVSKPIVELAEDLRREGLIAEDLERAVLGEDDERDEQATAEDRPPRLAERDTKERRETGSPRGCGRSPLDRGRLRGGLRRLGGRRADRPRASSPAPRLGIPTPT